MNILGSFMVPHPPLIIPEVGRGSEEQVKKTIDSYNNIADQIAELNPETIIISSPHTLLFESSFYVAKKDRMKDGKVVLLSPRIIVILPSNSEIVTVTLVLTKGKKV